jgi:hypothetical protein
MVKRYMMNLMLDNFDLLIKDFKINEDGFWCYNKDFKNIALPSKGFKIHISATIINALEIFKIVNDILSKYDVIYKVISSIKKLSELNSGLYGYSQIGKFITIYVNNISIINILLEELYIKTLGFQSVSIPSDFRYKNSYIVFYRYGDIIQSSKKHTTDKRIREIPKNIKVPIPDYYIKRFQKMPDEYIIIACLRSRGKSRVFQGINKNTKTPIIIKEGLMLGEVDLFGYDGVNSIINEKEMMINVSKIENFPKLIDYFYLNTSFCIVTEFIPGKSILQLILDKEYEILRKNRKNILISILNILEKLNNENIIIGDFSFDNIILFHNNIKLIDLEFYYFKNEKKYSNPETYGFFYSNYKEEMSNLYSVLSMWYFLMNPKEYRNDFLSKNKKIIENNINKYAKLDANILDIFNNQNYKNSFELTKKIILKGLK